MSKKKVAIIGLGWGTKVQVPHYRKAGFEVAALCGRNLEKTQRFASELQIPIATIQLSDVLENPDIDLIYIGTPPLTHEEMSIAALKAGKHVLCEKPMAFTTEATERMCAVAAAYPNQLSLINHELRYLSSMQAAKKVIQNGDIGEIFAFEAKIMDNGYLEKPPQYSWKSHKELAGGIALAICSHIIDSFHWQLQEDLSLEKSLLKTPLSTAFDAENKPHPVTSDQWAQLLVNTDSGKSGLMTASFAYTGEPIHLFEFHGTKGKLTLDHDCAILTNATNEATYLTETRTKEQPFVKATPLFAEQILKALQTGDFSTCLGEAATFDDGHKTQKLLNQALNPS